MHEKSVTIMGERLRQIRENLQLSKAKFAEALGISSPNTIYRWERGQAYPPADILEAMYRLYRVNLHWLVTGEESPAHEGGVLIPTGSAASPQPQKPLRPDLLLATVEGVELWLNKHDRNMDPERKAELVLLLYEVFLEKGKIELDFVERQLKLVA